MKINRNVEPAHQRAASNKAQIRGKIVKKIRSEILPEWCPKEVPCIQCDAKPVTKCMSFSELARTLNTMKIGSVQNHKGSWQPTMVKRLFRDEQAILGSDTPVCSH